MFACNSSKEEVRCRAEKEKGRKAENSLKVQQKHTAAKEKKNRRKKQKKKSKEKIKERMKKNKK
ncbi:hypothetical protein [Candidatus Cardinium hertigii]|uniref:Uncharacterized protein n=1 Tax=Candidatus Cardinium hertigii TaxID=247481 RepID=A0A2Z3L9N6_9BACT|nr:hypothetical protein [Candidatus Cardinium hertigii]AWN82228.1 hypothetical protein DK880_00930 [Candidatus Cardinium hertigii]